MPSNKIFPCQDFQSTVQFKTNNFFFFFILFYICVCVYILHPHFFKLFLILTSYLYFWLLFFLFLLKIITNGIYQSIEHRAIVNCEKERLSIATFHSPNQDSIIGPLESLIIGQTPARKMCSTRAKYVGRRAEFNILSAQI